MFKQTLLAVAIGTLVGVVSPQVTAATEMTPAQTQQLFDIMNAARIEAVEKGAQTAKEAGDEKRATLYEAAAQQFRDNPLKADGEPTTAAQAESKAASAQATADTSLSPEQAALAAEMNSVVARGTADALQAKANEPGAEAFLKESAAEATKLADTAAQDATTAQTAAQEAAAKEATAAEPAAAEAAPEPAAEPVAETTPGPAAEPAAEAAPEPAAESSGGE